MLPSEDCEEWSCDMVAKCHQRRSIFVRANPSCFRCISYGSFHSSAKPLSFISICHHSVLLCPLQRLLSQLRCFLLPELLRTLWRRLTDEHPTRYNMEGYWPHTHSTPRLTHKTHSLFRDCSSSLLHRHFPFGHILQFFLWSPGKHIHHLSIHLSPDNQNPPCSYYELKNRSLQVSLLLINTH